jgi:alanine racemase
MAVLKANAYGHGLLASARSCSAADAYGVVELDAALHLREAGIDKRICLLEGLFRDDDPARLARYKLEPVIHSEWQVQLLSSYKDSVPLDVWLKIDTGMHRLGFPAEQAASIYERLTAMPNINVVAIMSHLANADDVDDDKTRQQLAILEHCHPQGQCDMSLANSAAVCAWPDTHLDWVRPGIMLYGSSPLLDRNAAQLDLQAAMSFFSEVISIQTLNAGDAVGYGSTWLCPEAMRVGIIACGYGDGYPRHAPDGTPVLVDGKTVPLVGRVSMDMIAVDLRGHDDAQVGSVVELWGENLSVDTVARHAGTISYELLCSVTARVTRVEDWGD